MKRGIHIGFGVRPDGFSIGAAFHLEYRTGFEIELFMLPIKCAIRVIWSKREPI